MQDTKGYSIT